MSNFPKRYGNCNCECHVSPVMHCAPCCYPEDESTDDEVPRDWNNNI